MKSPPECKLRGVSNVLWLLMATGLMVLRPEAGEAKAATHAAPLRQDARVAAQPDVAYHYRPFRMHDPFRPFLKREKASIRKPARRTTGIPPPPDVPSPLQEAAVTQ